MKHIKIFLIGMLLASIAVACIKDNPDQLSGSSVTLNCRQPEFLKAGDKVALISPAHPQNITGKASGVLVGGNICTFAPNLGTQADATLGEDIILFIEEVEESMHNIDRQFNILAINRVLDRCKGVILGEFTDCGTEFNPPSSST